MQMFLFFYYKYTKLDRQIYESGSYLHKQVLGGGEGPDRHAVLVS